MSERADFAKVAQATTAESVDSAKSGMLVAGCLILDTGSGYGLRVSRYALRVLGYGIPVV